MERIPCSVPILTLNVREYLARLLPVLQEAFEDVFIVDGNSTDGTVEYARSLGIRVERQFDHDVPNSRISDFTQARLRSWSFARQQWIFLVDADEAPTPELIAHVRVIIQKGDGAVVHRFRRIVRLPDGRIVQRAFFYPEETMIRLFSRSAGVSLSLDRKVHERFQVPPGVSVMRHAEAFVHAWPDSETVQRKLDHYVSLEYGNWSGRAAARFRWIVWYNLRSAMGQLIRATWVWVAGIARHETVLPWSYTWPMIWYRFRTMYRGLRRPSR